MRLQHAIYNALLPVAALGARIAAPFNAKIAEGLKGREGFRPRWKEKWLRSFSRRARMPPRSG